MIKSGVSQLHHPLGGKSSSPSQCHMMHCSNKYAPNSWAFFRCTAASTEGTHLSLYTLGLESISLHDFANKENALHGMACSPWSKSCCTCALTWLSKISSLVTWDEWRASFLWSHISHNTFQSFLINSVIHCLLDFFCLH